MREPASYLGRSLDKAITALSATARLRRNKRRLPRMPCHEEVKISAEVQDLAVRYGAAWAAHDLDAIMALHSDDTVFHLHGDAAPAVGLAAVREAFAGAMAQWPDIRFERKRVHVGSAHFVSEYVMAATQAGQQIVCDGVDVFSVRDGLVARKDTYLDWAAVHRQATALTETASA
jgi:ketosteroid isomerase-like protein